MKKSILKFAALLTALLCAACIISCGKKDAVPEEEKPAIEQPTDKPVDGEGENLTYAQRMQKYFAGMPQTSFTTFVTSLAQYENAAQPVANALYASPTGNGDGSISSPYSLQDALDEVKAGQTLYLRGGTYNAPEADGYFLTRKGSENAYITVRNYPGENAVIQNANSGSETYGFQVDAKVSYVILEGIEICSVKARNACGIAFWGDGQSNIIIRNCNIHDIKTTTADPEKDEDAGANALLLLGEKKTAISNIAIIDNYCHDNLNGWTENISVTANCENIYVVGNRVENCSNIGIDFDGNEGYCSTPSLDQPRFCLAAGNTVKNIYCSYAECAGLYVDGARDVLFQYNEISSCQFGIEIGSEQRKDDYPVKNVTVKNNVCKNNLLCGLRIGGYEEVKTGVVKDVKVQNNELVENGESEILLAKVDGVEFKENSISAKQGSYLVSTDFTQAYTKNLIFTGNVFFVKETAEKDAAFYMFGKEYVGVNAFNALVSGDNIYKN